MSHKRNEALRHVQHSMHHVIAAGEGSDRAPATALKTAQKQPSGLFLAARLAISTRAHQKTSTYESTLRFLFCCKARLTGRVDSNSCGDIAEDGAKTARWAVFSSAARDIHPRPPKEPA